MVAHGAVTLGGETSSASKRLQEVFVFYFHTENQSDVLPRAFV